MCLSFAVQCSERLDQRPHVFDSFAKQIAHAVGIFVRVFVSQGSRIRSRFGGKMSQQILMGDAKSVNLHRPADRLNAVMLDDNEIDQRELERLVKKAEMPVECVFAADVDTFQHELDRNVFDVAFLDYHLVGENGFDAVRKLRSHATNHLTPVIMVSGDAPPELVVQAMRSGCSGYLPKDNLTPETLGHSINLALQDLTRLQFAGFSEVDLRQTTQKILDGVQKVNETELRQAANRIFRATNFLRQCQVRGYQADIDTYDILEHECSRILKFLDDMDTYCRTWSRDTVNTEPGSLLN